MVHQPTKGIQIIMKMNKYFFLLCVFLQWPILAESATLSLQKIEERLRSVPFEDGEASNRIIQDVLASKDAELVVGFLSLYNGGPRIVRDIEKLEDFKFKDEIYMLFLERRWPLDLGDGGVPDIEISYYELAICCIKFVNQKLGINLKPKSERNLKEFMTFQERKKYAFIIKEEQSHATKTTLPASIQNKAQTKKTELKKTVVTSEKGFTTENPRSFAWLYWVLGVLILVSVGLLGWNSRKGSLDSK